MFSLLPLLLEGSSVSLEARRALRLASTAPDQNVAMGLKRSAARALIRDFDLTWDEAAELVELPSTGPLQSAAA
ncbi:MAG: hypothetical protein ACT4TC_05265 [Myxococcaceae bacterium]